MPWIQALQILNPFGIIKSVLEGKQRKREIKERIHEKTLDNIQKGRLAEAEWNNSALKYAGWKDDWLTLLLSIPLVLAFYPSAVPGLEAGFAALEQMPLWYQSAIGVMIAASFGYKKFADAMMRTRMNKAYVLPKEEK